MCSFVCKPSDATWCASVPLQLPRGLTGSLLVLLYSIDKKKRNCLVPGRLCMWEIDWVWFHDDTEDASLDCLWRHPTQTEDGGPVIFVVVAVMLDESRNSTCTKRAAHHLTYHTCMFVHTLIETVVCVVLECSNTVSSTAVVAVLWWAHSPRTDVCGFTLIPPPLRTAPPGPNFEARYLDRIK